MVINNGIPGGDDIFILKAQTTVEHGSEIEEIISKRPSYAVRWGLGVVFIIVLLLLSAAWFIKYPDIITARGVLNSINAPKGIQAKINGKLIKLIAKENQRVSAGELLGHMESTGNAEEIIRLKALLDTMSTKTSDGNTNELLPYLNFSFNHLGELQSSYQAFSNNFAQFSNYLINGFYLKKKTMLAQDIRYIQRLHATLVRQKQLLTRDLSLTDSTFRAQEVLKNEKVISITDYRTEESRFLAKQMTLPQVNLSLINNESQQHEKEKEIAELENQIRQQKNVFVQSLNTIKSQVEEWENKYLLTAPINGRISFTTFLQENQELKAGQLICFVNPENTNYYVEALVPQYNFGKVKTGQEVRLKFQAYPYAEFGSVPGKIDYINSIPSDSGYLARVSLEHGLLTNYKKSIQYRTGLTAQVDIIAENMNLFSRLFYGLRKMVSP